MKILVVNAYSQSPEGKRKYREFFEALISCISEQNENLEGRNHQLIERDKNSLDDYLFDYNSIYYRKEAGINFDLLDLVCVVGDTNLLPWMTAAQTVLILLKMCLRVKKWLFAAGFGMHALIYLSASNIEKPIKVINGNERGGKIVEISQIDSAKYIGNQSYYFLDHVTGDLYSLNHERDEWIPTANVGLHYKRAALEFNSIGKYVIKSPVYIPKKLNDGNLLRDLNEVVCMIKKHLFGYWLFHGCDTNFVVSCESKWQVHPFAFVDKSKVFKELAASKDGPMIIEFQNIIAVQFDIKKRYPISITILKNFVSAKLCRMVEEAQVCSILDCRDPKYNDSVTSEMLFKKPKNKISDHLNDKTAARRTRGFRLSGEPIVGSLKQNVGVLKQKLGDLFEATDKNGIFIPPEIDLSPFKHSGFASKQRGPVIVEKNNILNDRIHVIIKKSPTKDGLFDSPVSSIQNKFRQHFLQKAETSETKKPRSPERVHTVAHNLNTSHNLLVDTSESAINPNAKSKIKSTINNQSSITFNRSKIRRALYPELNEDFVKNQTAWVPGNLSAQKKESDKKVIRVTDNMYGTGIFFKKRRKFSESSLNELNSHQSVLISTPYVSQEDLRAIDKRESAKKILHGTYFYTSSNFAQTQNTRPSTQGENRSQQLHRKASAPNMKI